MSTNKLIFSMLENKSSHPKAGLKKMVSTLEISCFSPLCIEEVSADQFGCENVTVAFSSTCGELRTSCIL